ncbi:RNA polymerase sigma factor [Paenibacillus rigui]|uniref:RNA polymerase sigma factor n=1 Tax=Paenibacillus rigui TaxID=554312 RepID=A0A229UGA9_9BACL|nr:RNA polymerase sigma factor [Paenibacillus rigui]OXM82411.1 hypothetical protein CF651_31120 [Paenibacillus rigui]
MRVTTEAGSVQHGGDRQRFTSLMEPFRPALLAYCRSIAHSSWEADDLVQDTWLKAYRMFLREPSREDLSKTYLFRIAHNTWIDRCRQKKRHPLAEASSEWDLPMEKPVDGLELRAAMEALVAYLPARQRVLLLLIDTLGFTASETARLIRSTEGAVKAGLHRARAKLKSLRDGVSGHPDDKLLRPSSLKVDEQVVYAYLQAFQQHNPYALVRLLNEEVQRDALPAVIGMKSGKKREAQAVHQLPHPSCLMLRAA